MDLSELFPGPIGNVSTSQGVVYLYSLADLSMKDLRELPAAGSPDRTLAILRKVSSLHEQSSAKEDPPPLPGDVLDRLSDGDIEAIAEVFRIALHSDRAVAAAERRPDVGDRQQGESAVSFLQRVFDADLAARSASAKKLLDGAVQEMAKHTELFRAVSDAARLKDAIESPALRAAKEAAHLGDLINGPAARAAQEIAKNSDMFRMVGDAARLQDAIESPALRAAKGLHADASVLAKIKAAQQMQDAIDGPAGRALKDLKASSEKLGSTLDAAERLNLGGLSDFTRGQSEQFARIAEDRREDRERIRLTSQMTAESADMLRKLVAAASEFMVRFDTRDQKGDKDLRRQLRITVVSIVISTFLAAGSLIYAGLGFHQDRAKNAADDASARAAAAVTEQLANALKQNNALLQQNAELLKQLREVKGAPPVPAPKR